MLQRYESLYIAVPEITQDEASKVESHLTKAVKDAKGALISFERWGKYHLTYPIRKNEYGVYYLIRFEVEDETKDELLKSIKALFKVKLHDLVMRNVVLRLHPEGSLEYKRPESLEEAPKEIDTIMKESKHLLRAKKPYSDRSDEAPQKEDSPSAEETVEKAVDTEKE